MSPSTLRRYRAERLLRQEFGGLREEVLGSVRGAAACQRGAARAGRPGSLLRGGLAGPLRRDRWRASEIANPRGGSTVVTFRRAIDEHRHARVDTVRAAMRQRRRGGDAGREPDLAAELDDRARLRQLFEALRGA